jgi:putative flippase GtrA
LLGFLVNIGAYSIQLDLTGTPPYLAAIGAFCVAVGHNHLLNRVWTFDQQDAGYVRQGVRFLVVSLFALAVNLFVLQALLSGGLGQVPAQSLAVAAAMPAGFLGNRRWTFKERR